MAKSKHPSWTFADGIQGGLAGLYLSNAHSHFDDVVVSNYRVDDFRDGEAGGWSPSAGEWVVEDPVQGVYSGQHTDSALSLWAQTMTEGWLGAQMTTQSWPGHYLNAYLVFDYQDAGNYKYAGMADGGDEWVIREVIEGTIHTRATLSETIHTGQRYAVRVEVSGDTTTLKVDGDVKVSHTFAGGVHGGPVGLLVNNAHSHFEEAYVRRPVNVSQYYYVGGQRIALR